ncbi:hypothetical protein ACWEQ4_01270 [Rhodococcus sp. NPDC003994]
MPSFNRKTWVDSPDTSTPITAAELNRMEAGITAASATLATEASIRARVTALTGTGGVVDLPAGNITLTSPLPLVQGITYRGVMPVTTPKTKTTPGYLGDMEWDFVGGTVLVGNGTFPAFAANNTDLGSPADPIGNTQISHAGIENVGIDNVTYGIHVGARNTIGAVWGTFRNIFVRNASQWGVRFVNFQHCTFENIKTCLSQNAQFYGNNLAASILMCGNSSFDELFNIIPRDGRDQKKCRGIVFDAGLGDGVLNELQVGRIQANQFRDTAYSVNGTVASGSANVTVSDGTQFAIGMPVVATTSVGGFNTNQTYLVASITGNVLTLKDHVSAAARTATGAGTLGLTTYGFPNVEITRQGGTASVRHSTFAGLDLEGGSSASLYVDGASSVKLHVNEIPFFHHNDLVLRQSQFVQVTTGVAMRTDVDGDSSSYQYQGQRDRIVGVEGTGFWLNSLNGARELSLSGYSGGPELVSRDGGFWYGRFGENVRPGGFSTNLDPGWMGHAVWGESTNRTYTIVDATTARIGSWHQIDNVGTGTVTLTAPASAVFNKTAGLTSISIPAKSTARITCLASDDGSPFWMVVKQALATN